jgi:hypothetical protein
MSTLDGWLDTIANGPDLEKGLCIGNWDLFDDVDLPDEALALCRQCSVQQRCADWSATLSDRELSGVVAGVVRVHPSNRRTKETVWPGITAHRVGANCAPRSGSTASDASCPAVSAGSPSTTG